MDSKTTATFPVRRHCHDPGGRLRPDHQFFASRRTLQTRSFGRTRFTDEPWRPLRLTVGRCRPCTVEDLNTLKYLLRRGPGTAQSMPGHGVRSSATRVAKLKDPLLAQLGRPWARFSPEIAVFARNRRAALRSPRQNRRKPTNLRVHNTATKYSRNVHCTANGGAECLTHSPRAWQFGAFTRPRGADP